MLPSFCRVTGNSRNLPKPNYFPLLPPISPLEAKRICNRNAANGNRNAGATTYVPVIEFARRSKAVLVGVSVQQCRITAKHQINPDYHYVFPQLKTTSNKGSAANGRQPQQQQHHEDDMRQLNRVLERMASFTKGGDDQLQPGQSFVYRVEKTKTNIVLPAAMEVAIRKGEIENLSLASDGSSALIRLKNGPSLNLNLSSEGRSVEQLQQMQLMEGGGQDEQVLIKQKQIGQYRKRKISDPKMTTATTPEAAPEQIYLQVFNVDWTARMARLTDGHRSATNLLIVGTEWRDLVYPKVESWDWETMPQVDEDYVLLQAQKLPARELEPIQLPVEQLTPGYIPPGKVQLNEEMIGFEAVPIFDGEIQPQQKTTTVGKVAGADELPVGFVKALDHVKPNGQPLSKLKDLFSDVESLMVLPFMHELGKLLPALDSGKAGWFVREQDAVTGDSVARFVTTRPAADVKASIGGVMVHLPSSSGIKEERFIAAQQVGTFGWVPGKTFSLASDGSDAEFQCGCLIQHHEGAGFIPGCLLSMSGGSGPNSNKRQKQFHAGQIIEGSFVHGQSLQTLFGPKFICGKTIYTETEGLKFAAGQTTPDGIFHVGQVFQTPTGPVWVSGVTFDTPNGARFVAGLTHPVTKEFCSGQTVDDRFVSGETIETADGPVFIPGVSFKDKTTGQVYFCPGRPFHVTPNSDADADENRMMYIPGQTITGADDKKQFVAGVIMDNQFLPCTLTTSAESNQMTIVRADREEDVFFRPLSGEEPLPIDNMTFTAGRRKKPDMGYMIQHDTKIKFLPTEQSREVLLPKSSSAGINGTSENGNDEIKAVPGQLLEPIEEDVSAKFIPGKTIESALGQIFIPGQTVKTGVQKTEQFVPGQVIDSVGQFGPMFCPGQMVQCGGELGKRFIPGQVFSGKNGPRFVPGKILVSPTSGASTFVPGQVFFTDSGSRFIPGNIVDTSQGPYFVPGRVLDLPNGTFKFCAGEIVETESGPRYVAPYETDLVSAADDGWTDDDSSQGSETEQEKDQQLLVQGFPVSPEELRLITAYPYAALHYPANDSSALINSRMLKQMAAAGVAVHRLTNTSNSANDNAGIDDVKIRAPDVDEAILGADIFRTTDPVPVPTKIRRVSKVPPPPPKPQPVAEPPPPPPSPPPVAPPVKASIEAFLPSDVSVFERQLLSLSAKISGNPPPEFKWYQNEKELKDGDDGGRVSIRLVPESTAQLEITSADAKKDSGVYKLVVSNEIGDTTSQTNVQVKTTPVKASIEEALPSDVAVFERQLLLLSAKVSGNPLPNVQWFKDGKGPLTDGVRLLPDGTAQLEILSADPTKDSGIYKLVAVNASGGEVTTQTKVDVKTTPVKASIDAVLPSELTVIECQPLRLSAKVSGNPLPEVNWFKDGKLIIDDGHVSVKLLHDGTAKLEIVSADITSDSGVYQLEATNATGKVTTQTKVDVKTMPVKASIEEALPSDVIVFEKQLLRLSAKVSGNPLPDVQWFKDGKGPLKDGVRILPDGTAQLEIASADPARDSGVYKLVAVNASGGAVTTQTKVDVKTTPVKATIDAVLPAELTVIERQPLHLSAKVSGNPLPNVKWYKEGKLVSNGDDGGRISIRLLQDGTATLEIVSADVVKDSGTYKLEAVNSSVAAVTSQTKVLVKSISAKASIDVSLPSDVVVFERQPLRLNAKISGNPPPVFKWYKNENELKDGDDGGRVSIQLVPESTAQLEITSADAKKDSGVYKLVVSNEIGDTTSQTNVQVKTTPVKASIEDALPSDVIVFERQLLLLSAKVSGNPLPDVQWFKDGKGPLKDGVRLLPDGTAQLEIASADATKDSGVYKLVAVNASGGEVTTQTKVDVKTTPVKASIDAVLPSELTVIEQQPLRLSAKVSGNPLPNVKWFKDGKLVVDDDHVSIKLLQDGTAKLEIASTDLTKDSGVYKLEAVNATGKVTTQTKVDVLMMPVKATIDMVLPTDLTITERQPLHLSAKVSGNPVPALKWFKDGKPLIDGGRISIRHLQDGTVTLDIASTDPAKDAGVYKLEAVNSSGGAVTSQTNVVVKTISVKASIEKTLPNDVSVFEKQPLRLSAKMSGNPPPEFKWYKDEKELKDGDDGGRVSIKLVPESTAQLEINSADAKKDSGVYKLVVSNEIGNTTSQTNVQVKTTPVKASIEAALPSEVTVYEKQLLRLSAKVSGNPLPDILWFKDGKGPLKEGVLLLPDGTAQIEIESAEPTKDSGVYQLVAVNASGEVTTQTKVDVKTTPVKATIEEPLPFQVTVVERQPLRLSAKVSGNPLPDVNWFKDENELKDGDDDGRVSVRLLPEGTAQLEIAAADPVKDSGNYKMVASNPIGETKTETNVEVQKAPQKAKVDEPLPKIVTVAQGEPLHLIAKVSGNPPPDVIWTKDKSPPIQTGQPSPGGGSYVVSSHPDGTVELEVKGGAKPEDSGNYSLVVSNDLGESKCDSQVEVKSAYSVFDFFKRIKCDLDSVERDPFIRDTLVMAESWASENGRPDLADKVRQLLDILKNTEQDTEVCELIQLILRMRTLPNSSGVSEANAAAAAALTASAKAKRKSKGKGTSLTWDEANLLEESEGVSAASSNDDGSNKKERKMAKRTKVQDEESALDEQMMRNNVNKHRITMDEKMQQKNKRNAASEGNKLRKEDEGGEEDGGEAINNNRQNRKNKVKVTGEDGTEDAETKTNKSSANDAAAAAESDDTSHPITRRGRNKGQCQPSSTLTDPSSSTTTLSQGDENTRLASSGVGSTSVGGSLGEDGSSETTDQLQQQLQAKMIDHWTYLNSSVVNGEDAAARAAQRRARNSNRRVCSRSSSRALAMRKSMERDLSEEDAADIPQDDPEPVPTIVPPVITSAKDISRDIIDVLRYSRDEAKKELYTQKILEAVGLGNVSDDSDESCCSNSGGKPRLQHQPRRKGSACIILKDFLQTIVPSTAAHGVLYGDVDYMIVDDEGVRYFESASGFASRRNSRFDIRQSLSQRESTERETAGPMPNPWVDVGPRHQLPSGASISAAGSRRTSIIDDFRKRLAFQDQDASASVYYQPPSPRSRSRERPPPHGRHSTTSVPISRSNSGYITPIHSRGTSVSRRSSLVDTELSLSIAAAAAAATMGRKRSVLSQQASSDQLLPPLGSSLGGSSSPRRSFSNRNSFDLNY